MSPEVPWMDRHPRIDKIILKKNIHTDILNQKLLKWLMIKIM
jgi:hypothetical protein